MLLVGEFLVKRKLTIYCFNDAFSFSLFLSCEDVMHRRSMIF